MDTKTCKSCRSLINKDAKICPYCQSKQAMGFVGKFFLTIFVIGFVGSAVGNLLKSSNPEKTENSSEKKSFVAVAKNERQLGAAVAAMRKSVDKVEGITWYKDPSSPKTLNQNIVMLYIGDKDARPWLRLEIQYYADTWLFVQTATFVVDGEKRSTNSGGWERDNDTHIYEWLDIGIDQKLAQDIANGEEVILRLKGKHYQKDRTLTKAEKTAMKNVLKAYAELGGN